MNEPTFRCRHVIAALHILGSGKLKVLQGVRVAGGTLSFRLSEFHDRVGQLPIGSGFLVIPSNTNSYSDQLQFIVTFSDASVSL